MMRKLVKITKLTLHVKHYKDDAGKEHIDIQQVGTGGFKGNFEPRTLDYEDYPIDDPFYGHVGELRE